MALEYEQLQVNIEASVCRIMLNDPGQGNALDEVMRQELLQALLSAQDDDSVRLVVLTGAGSDFCVGVPSREISGLRESGSGFERVRALLDEGRRIISLLNEYPKPVIAGLNGAASREGAALALACDIRVAGETATLALDFSRTGMSPAWGSSATLTRLGGPGTALELLWTGRTLSAEEASRRGLIEVLVSEDRFGSALDELCQAIVAVDGPILQLTRMAVQSSHSCDLPESLDLETEIQHRCWTTGTRRGAGRN